MVTSDTEVVFEHSADELEWHELARRTIADLATEVKPQLHSGSYGDVGQEQAFDLLTVCQAP